MRGLKNLKTRLDYNGGSNQQDRMVKDKLRSLKKALLYSYQAETIILSDGRKFRCLLNSDKTKADYDCKLISIPFDDICLGRRIEYLDKDTGKIVKKDIINESKDLETIGLKPGDIFECERDETYWIVYLQKLEEKSYFRAETYKCEDRLEIDGRTYHVYIRGPVETTIQWNQKKDNNWNDLNYSLIIYITKDDFTLNHFHRFTKVKVNGETWEVKTVDPYSADGILEICLGEYYENPIEELSNKNKIVHNENNELKPYYIEGETSVYPFDIREYRIHGLKGGVWLLDDSKRAIIRKSTDNSVTLEVISGKRGDFILTYKTKDHKVSLPIEIKSF